MGLPRDVCELTYRQCGNRCNRKYHFSDGVLNMMISKMKKYKKAYTNICDRYHDNINARNRCPYIHLELHTHRYGVPNIGPQEPGLYIDRSSNDQLTVIKKSTDNKPHKKIRRDRSVSPRPKRSKHRSESRNRSKSSGATTDNKYKEATPQTTAEKDQANVLPSQYSPASVTYTNLPIIPTTPINPATVNPNTCASCISLVYELIHRNRILYEDNQQMHSRIQQLSDDIKKLSESGSG